MSHSAQIGQMAAQGMANALSAEVGMMGHFAHLNETYGTPNPIPEPMPAPRRGR
jgi:hypothetical protein